MSKKLICLFLAAVMLLGIFLTSCGQTTDEEAKTDIENSASQSATTLVMYLMSEKPVDAETEKAIEDAVNKITKNKFKTKLELYFYTEAEYYAKLDAAFAERDWRKANNQLINTTQPNESGEDETETSSTGQIEIKYPEVTNYQVDIFYLGGKANYDKYSNDKRLARLDEELATSELNSYIPSQYLTTIKALNGRATYALPTTKVIGEYTYLLLNKQALKDAYRGTEITDYSSYTSLTCEDVKDFMDYVNSNKNNPQFNYTTLYTDRTAQELETELLINNIKYWGLDENGNLSDDFSILGGYYGKNDEYLDKGKYAEISNLFENEAFIQDIKTLKEYELRGYYETNANADGKFAVGYVSGGKELAEKYGEDYVMVPVELPRLSEEELYSDMFAICSYTSSVSRSMKILSFLNTNEDIRNILLYGIEDTHYKLENTRVNNMYGEEIFAADRLETGELHYLMDVNKTGNTLIVYPNADNQLPNFKEYAVKQNQDAKIRLDLGFTLDFNKYVVDKDSLGRIRELSAKVMKAYSDWNGGDAVDNGVFKEDKYDDAFAAFLDTIVGEDGMMADYADDIAYHTACPLTEELEGKSHKNDGTVVGKDSRCGSLYCCYHGWLKSKKITD